MDSSDQQLKMDFLIPSTRVFIKGSMSLGRNIISSSGLIYLNYTCMCILANLYVLYMILDK